MASGFSAYEIFQLQSDKLQYRDFLLDGNGTDFKRLADEVCKSALNELSEKQKLYIMASVYDGLSCTEIASLYGVNKSTVSRTISRAKENLRKVLRYSNRLFINC